MNIPTKYHEDTHYIVIQANSENCESPAFGSIKPIWLVWKVRSQSEKLKYIWKGIVTGNVQGKYESKTSYGSKVKMKVKVFKM